MGAVVFVSALVLLGWGYLIAMVADMVPVMDMTEAGPGMGLLNNFNLFAGLPAEARAALAVLCLPGQVATFGMPGVEWSAWDIAKIFVMWLMMALAMMLPSAIPMLKAYSDHLGRAQRQPSLNWPILQVVFGYLVVWTGYAVLATAAQWVVHEAGMLSQMMAPVSMVFAGTTLVAAGFYQFTPAKHACLARCWYPTWVFSSADSGPQWPNAAREGIVQGLACLGCCWAIMAVMFAVGVMNVIWIAILGTLMAVEKNWPLKSLRFVIGVFFIIWGATLLLLATGQTL